MERRPRGARFVGRTAELELLDAALARLGTSHAGGLLITGEPGIGKSRLVDELRHRASAAGAVVAIGQTSPGGEALPFGTIVSLTRDLRGHLDHDEAAAVAELHRQLLGGAGVASSEGRIARLVLFDAVLSTVGRLAQDQPVILVLEDLHWADSGSVGMVDHLVRNLQDVPLLVVATYRPGEVGVATPSRRALAELRNLRSTSTIDLGGLERDEIGALLADATGTTPPWTVVDAIHRRSEGNPLFAEELFEVTDRSALPPALAELLSVRIDGLDPPARTVVGSAAVLGVDDDHGILTAIVDLSGVEFGAAVEEAVRAGVLTIDPTGTGLRFRHALLQEAAYALLVPSERARLHGRAADAIELGDSERSGVVVAAVAEHRYRAGQWSAACAASLAAADASLAVHEVNSADAHLRRAVEAHRRASGTCTHADEEADVLGRAAAVAYLAGGYERAARLAERTLALLDPASAPEAVAEAGTTCALAAQSAGDDARAFEVVRSLTVALASTGSIEAQAELACTEARMLMASGHGVESNRCARRALELARPAGLRTIEGHALATMVPNLAARGEFSTAVEMAEQALAIAEEVGDANLLLRAWTNYSDVHLTTGRYEQAAASALAALRRSTPRDSLRLGGTGANGVQALVSLGRWDEAEVLARALDPLVVASCVSAPSMAALITLRRGGLDAVEPMLAAPAAALPQSQANSACILAELAIERDDIDGCLALVDQALGVTAGIDLPIETVNAHALGLRAMADRARLEPTNRRGVGERSKDRQVAESMVDEVEATLAKAAPDGAPSAVLQAAVVLCRAEAARLCGDDPDPWTVAATEFEALGDQYYRAYCTFRDAEARLAHRGDRKAATALLVEASGAAKRLGAGPLLERCERLAERAKVRLTDAHDGPEPSPKARVGADLGLTPREVDVLALLAYNRTDGEIAAELFISKKTASVHVSNILRKLDVAGRRQAGVLGREAGMSGP